jgi:hypothetical protein
VQGVAVSNMAGATALMGRLNAALARRDVAELVGAELGADGIPALSLDVLRSVVLVLHVCLLGHK